MERYETDDVNYEPYMFFRYGRKKESETENLPHDTDKSRGKKLIAVLTVAVLFCLSIFVADLYANDGILAVWKDKTEDVSKTFYVYCTDSFRQNSQGLIAAKEVKNAGGAGYLFFDRKYYLAASVYVLQTDAETVRKNTANAYGSVYELNVKNPELKWCDEKHKSAVKKAIVSAYDMYDALYDVSVKLDTGELNIVDAVAKINVLQANIDELTSDFDTITKSNNKFGYEKVKTYLCILSALSANAKAEILAGVNPSGAVRYAYTAAVFLASQTTKSL